jgi:hypothetical protein
MILRQTHSEERPARASMSPYLSNTFVPLRPRERRDRRIASCRGSPPRTYGPYSSNFDDVREAFSICGRMDSELATPAVVAGWSSLNGLRWQALESAPIDLIRTFRALANLPVREFLSDHRSGPAIAPIESKMLSEKKRAALLESIGRPGSVTTDGASNGAKHITDPLYALNGNVRPLCRNDAGALTASLLMIFRTTPCSHLAMHRMADRMPVPSLR